MLSMPFISVVKSLVIIFLLGSSNRSPHESISYKESLRSLPQRECRIIKVLDGDSFLCRDRIEIRLAGLDAPEKDMPGSREARQWLTKTLANRIIKIYTVDRDRYLRFIAFVFIKPLKEPTPSLQDSVNYQMIERGLAWVYYHHSIKPFFAKLHHAQKKAMDKRSGLWRYKDLFQNPVTGNRHSMRFHERECPSVRRMHPENRSFTTAWGAFYLGMAPARDCHPLKMDIKQKQN